MANYADHEEMESQVTEEDMKEMMRAKAHELFAVCDREEKGFITKRDMQRLQEELPLIPEQLEAVFDSLDDDSNGYLTLEEFTDGFGELLSPVYQLTPTSLIKARVVLTLGALMSTAVDSLCFY